MFIIEVKLNWIILFALFNKRIGGIRLVSAAMVLHYQHISLEIDFSHSFSMIGFIKKQILEIPDPQSPLRFFKNIEGGFSEGVEFEARW